MIERLKLEILGAVVRMQVLLRSASVEHFFAPLPHVLCDDRRHYSQYAVTADLCLIRGFAAPSGPEAPNFLGCLSTTN